jgi:mandelate racemase
MSAPVLHVRDLRARAVHVPMKRPLTTSTGTVSTAPLVLIDLDTEEGITGRAYVFCITPLASQLVREAVRALLPFVKGDAVAPFNIEQKVRGRLTLLGHQWMMGMAIAGLDMACWDALARAAGVPLARLLGGEPRPIAAYNSNGLGLMLPVAAADEAQELIDEGFTAIKIRLGRPTLGEDLAAVRAVRARIPDGTILMADFNQKLTVNEAIFRGRALDDEGLYWIEEPIRADDYAGNAKVAREIGTPVQIGENFNGHHAMAEAIKAGASDLVMPDAMRIGGISGWVRAAALADAAGLEMSSHLFPEVSRHLLAVTPTCHWLEFVDWAAPILVDPVRVVDGYTTAPEAPGIGIEWNEDIVARYTVV